MDVEPNYAAIAMEIYLKQFKRRRPQVTPDGYEVFFESADNLAIEKSPWALLEDSPSSAYLPPCGVVPEIAHAAADAYMKQCDSELAESIRDCPYAERMSWEATHSNKRCRGTEAEDFTDEM